MSVAGGPLLLALAACSKRDAPIAPAAQSASATSSPALAVVRDDPYDSAKMDYKPSAAALSNERHSGAFASGASINTQAALAPLDPSPIKEVRLDTTHKIIEIAPGVRFSAWTFGDTVPSPVIRARVGDRIKIKFSMTNRSDEPAPGIQLTAAPMMHSMDFHSATVSPQGKYRSIAPGRRSRSSSR